MLVDKQVEPANHTESALHLLIEATGDAIRRFLTLEQRLKQEASRAPLFIPEVSDFRRPPDQREQYFAALETLRGHLYRCLTQVSKIANIDIPKLVNYMKYDESLQIEAYKQPALP